jgi:hybrid cluster-associated redox disulfide protein
MTESLDDMEHLKIRRKMQKLSGGVRMTDKRIDAEWLIGDVLKEYPETLEVFKKYFGESCFTCPGAHLESIAFGSLMHGLDAERILQELNECIIEARVQ